MRLTYKLEAAADGGLDVGATEGGDLAELTGDLDRVVQEEAQATLVAEACCTGNLSEQDWGGEQGNRINKREGKEGGGLFSVQILFLSLAFAWMFRDLKVHIVKRVLNT